MSTAIAVEAPTRPALRYPGGKFRMAKKLIPFFPAHNTYVEPFGGGGSVLLAKEPAKFEVYNDLDEGVVNFFRVLRDPKLALELEKAISLTPYSRTKHANCWEPSDDPVEEARRMLVRSFQSIGVKHRNSGDGWRTASTRLERSPAKGWFDRAGEIPKFLDRLKEVVIECVSYERLFPWLDGEETLWYADPPYIGKNEGYVHTMTKDDHALLCERLRELKGMVILSGYDNEIYRSMLADWQTHSFAARAQGNAPRVEMIWINPATAARLQPQLFEVEP